ncbi:hypothetical protein [Litoribacillus peritrichatus]|uniref:Uncharacterized protein n=1 Tax=Litoribacillus peritrichatus TaxID=718191 RepID=A0ABP7NB63_9GAMM
MKFLLILLLSLTANAYAAPVDKSTQENLVLVGQVDVFTEDHLVLSDRFVPVSKLINCFDKKGKKLVSCSSISTGSWVEVNLLLGKNIANSQVIEMKSISASEGKRRLKELNND